MVLAETLAVTLKVARIFDLLQVPYLVGGSIASSLHGTPRSTHDVDMVADLEPGHVAGFIDACGKDFYVSEDAVVDAVARRSSFNIIDQATVLKVDVFLLKNDPLSQEEMRRRVAVTLPVEPEERLMVASAEDIILQKLIWYRLGQGVSDRQWRDVLGVLKVLEERIDLRYLRSRAEVAGVADLLARAMDEGWRHIPGDRK